MMLLLLVPLVSVRPAPWASTVAARAPGSGAG